MRQKALNPDSTGTIWVNIGAKKTKGGRTSQGKISLGTNPKDATRRLARIEDLWERIEKTSQEPLWDDLTFRIARLLGKGETQIILPQEPSEDEVDYARRINLLAKRFPSINFTAADFEEYEYGRQATEVFVEDSTNNAAEVWGVDFSAAGRPSDGSLHQAMDRYIEWIKREYFDQDEQHVNDNGMTKIRQVRTLKDHLQDRPLSTLGFHGIDESFCYFRKRPLSKRTEKPMKKKSCQNYIGELGRFFDWLDLSSDFSWRLPERYSRIKRKVDELDSDIAAEAADVFAFSDSELALLYKYSGPLDRLFILLGLNCAFGVDQTGRLRHSEVRLDRKPPIIRRIRRKKKVQGRHYLWQPTRVLLQWALDRRAKVATEASGEYLILNDSGNPFWRKTAGGNRARDIPNYWTRLLNRIRDDHPEFPKAGFNSLRDTSIDRIRAIAGQEVALIHATHKHHSPDENLRRYSNAPWKKVFVAQRKMERRLAGMFAAVPDPRVVSKQAYVSLGQRERIVEYHKNETPPREIAKLVGVSLATVYRTLEKVTTT